MSHFTRIRTQLRDLTTVRQALEDLGYEVETDAEVRGYMSQRARADLVVRAGGAYDIGFRAEGDSIVMVADLWGLEVDRDAFMKALTQRYAYHTVRQQAAVQGWQPVEEEVQADGSVRLVMQRWAS